MSLSVLIIHSSSINDHPSGELNVSIMEKNMIMANGDSVSHVLYKKNSNITTNKLLNSAYSIFGNIWSKKAYADVESMIKKINPDVVHFHGLTPYLSSSALKAAHDNGSAVVQTLHNLRWICLEGGFYRNGGYCDICVGRSHWNGVLRGCRKGVIPSVFFHSANMIARSEDKLFKWVDRFIAVSDFIREKHILDGFPDNKIVVKKNGIDLLKISKYHNVKNDRKGIAYVSRISESKGSYMIQKIIPRVKDLVHIVGDGPNLKELKEFCTKNKYTHVKFWGKQPQEKCYSIMSSVLCTVVPSQCGESFSLVSAESMALGTPVIGSEIGGLGELLKKSGGGIAVEYNKSDKFIEAIVKLKSNQKLYTSLSIAAKKYAEEELSISKNTMQLVSIYEDVIKEKRNNAVII